MSICYNAALYYYANNHFAKELSYQKSIGKLFCQYVLCDKATGEKLETKIGKKNYSLFTNSNSQMYLFLSF